MKKFTKLLSLFLFATVTQYSCINDTEVDTGSIHPDSEGNLSLSIEISNDPLSRSAESSGDTELGSEQEYAVKSLTLYLFDKETKTFVASYDLENIQHTSTVDKIVKYTANKIEVKPGIYNIFAIANGKAEASNINTQDKFLGAIDATTYNTGKISAVPENGFVMTNRGAANLGIVVEKPTDTDRVTNVSISLERVVAKIGVAQTQGSFPLKDPQGETYATIQLNNFRMLNLATQFYTFRHTAVLTSLQEPNKYTDENFGSINNTNGYIIDPYFFKKTVEGAKDFDNKDGFFAQALVNFQNDNWAGMIENGTFSYIYCLENGMFRTAQLNAYSTGVMFKANIQIAPNRVFNEDGTIVSDSNNWPANMFYFNYNFYTSINAIRKLVLNNLPGNITDASTTEELAKYSIKRFSKKENFECYYNYWIKHLDNESPEMGVMEFSIVRNNIYRISVTKILGLGSGDPFIDPEQPNEFKAELEADIDVFPWVVRNQDAELE